MALIPITFNKDDTNNLKKGIIRGQDIASALSVSMKNAGILDMLGNDPCGYKTINYSTGYATITMSAGYVAIYGRLIYVEEGTQVQIALPASGTVSGIFGIRINLSDTGSSECTWFTKTTTLQTDNLNDNPATGIYEFRLYDYTATPTNLTLTAKTTEKIVNIFDYLKGDNFTTQEVGDSSNKIATTEFVVKELANSLGFSKKSYQNNAYGLYNQNASPHYFTVLDILGTRLIYGTINALEANQPTAVSWGQQLLKLVSLDKAVFIPSFTTQTRTNPNDRGMDEPCHIMQVDTDKFVIYNSNGYTVTGTYLVIGEKP